MAEIDTTIQQLFDKLNQRKAKVAELKAQIAKSWKTTGTFRLIGAASSTNIQTASKDSVGEIAVQLCLLDGAQSTAAVRLGQPVQVKIQGYAPDDWFADLRKRLATIDLRSEEEQLATLETRLNQVLSPEERRRIEVEMLAKELG
jgi:superfamily I DNA and RNA helicase